MQTPHFWLSPNEAGCQQLSRGAVAPLSSPWHVATEPVEVTVGSEGDTGPSCTPPASPSQSTAGGAQRPRGFASFITWEGSLPSILNALGKALPHFLGYLSLWHKGHSTCSL